LGAITALSVDHHTRPAIQKGTVIWKEPVAHPSLHSCQMAKSES
jgi:hypothetical protein